MKFRMLADRLRERIGAGEWPVGARLPTEPRLAAEHGVGVNTVRRAVGILAGEGLVERRQGSGTYVSPPPPAVREPGRRVGVLVPSTTYYYPSVVRGVRLELAAARTDVVLASSRYRPDVEDAQLRALLAEGVDGLMLVPNLHVVSDPQRHVEALRRVRVPYVLAERQPPAPDDMTPCVATNHAGGVFSAVRHLVRLGHDRIGYLGRRRTGTSAAVADGFRRAMTGLGHAPVGAAVVCRPAWRRDELSAYARTCRDHRVSAVVCHGDRDAALLITYARSMGLRIPGDLAVIAYDDECADLSDPTLTTVAPPKAELGRVAARLLLAAMAGDPVAQRIELQPRLIVRASCGGSPPGSSLTEEKRS